MNKYYKNFDGLRGILASLVLLYHVPITSQSNGIAFFNSWAILNKGKESVYIFFVLSGFLIIGQLYNKNDFKSLKSIKEFYLRRVLRLYPVYYLVLVIGIITYKLLIPLISHWFSSNWSISEAVFYCVFFLPNVFSVNFAPVGGILNILWSIGVEEQFYILIAPFLAFTSKKRIPALLIFLFLANILLLLFDVSGIIEKYKLYYFFMISGGLISIVGIKAPKFFMNRYLRSLVYVLVILYFFSDFVFQLLNYKIVECILFSFFIGLLANDKRNLFSDKLSFLGKISYGMYMYHMIIVYITVFLFKTITRFVQFTEYFEVLLVNISIFIFTIIISYLSHKYYESYFLEFKKKFR